MAAIRIVIIGAMVMLAAPLSAHEGFCDGEVDQSSAVFALAFLTLPGRGISQKVGDCVSRGVYAEAAKVDAGGFRTDFSSLCAKPFSTDFTAGYELALLTAKHLARCNAAQGLTEGDGGGG